jgi:phenylacetate-CoA ligase
VIRDRAMPWLRRHVSHPAWRWKDDSAVARYLAEARGAQHLDPETLSRRQWEQLGALLDHCWQHVPFYRQRFERLGLHPGDLRGWEDFARLPPLTKRDLQREREALRSRWLPAGDEPRENMTGGSTGEPLHFFSSKRRNERREASTIRHNEWTGWRLGEPMVVLWGAPRDLAPLRALKPRLRHLLLEGHDVLDTMNLSREALERFVRRLRRRPPRVWLAYARSALLVARYLRELGLDDVQARAVITSAEVLQPEERELVESVLGARVYDRYGCRETSVVASECGHRTDHAMHVNADSLLVEVVEREPGGAGKILLTDLHNLATPFVRYQVEDVSRLVHEPCPCGRGLPLLAPLSGRVTDFLVTADRRLVSGIGVCTYLVTQLSRVERGQFEQERPGEVLFRCVAAPGFGEEDRRGILAACEQLLGADTRVEIALVEEIPRSASGKLPFTISRIDPFEVLA